MARKQAPTFDKPTDAQTWFLTKKDLEGKWHPVVRVGRHIPFGYEQDPNDSDILLPIQEELELLEQAKRYLAEYSLRLVSRWLTEQSGRYISHVGLKKRVNIEQKRRKTAEAHRVYERRYKEAAAKAQKLEERLGGRGTRTDYPDTDSDEGTSES